MRIPLIFLVLAGCGGEGSGGKAGEATAIGTPTPGFEGEVPKGALKVEEGAIGRYGGTLVYAQSGDPKTLNPLLANDTNSTAILHGAVFASCLGFHRIKQVETLQLCESQEKSADGLTYTFTLREGLLWSDGAALTSDDFEFSYAVLLDPAVPTSLRDRFRQGVDEQGEPRYPRFEKLDARRFRFHLAQKDVMFHHSAGDIHPVPRHKWEAAWKAGTFARSMLINTPPAELVSSGPFRIKEVKSDERLVLERNPRFWKVDAQGNRLPYLDRVVVLIVPDFNAAFLKFREGEVDVLEVRPEHVEPLERKQAAGNYVLADLGPSFATYWFAFNLDPRLGKDGKPYVSPQKQKWFQDKRFRKAVSHAIDREGIVRTVLAGRGAPLWGFYSPANQVWYTDNLVKYPYDLEKSRALLTEAGFVLKEGKLYDAEGNHVEFSMVTPAENPTRVGMLTVIKNDLARLGFTVHIRPVPFNDIIKSNDSRDFDAMLMGWSGAVPPDPAQSKSVLLSSGDMHVAAPRQAQPLTPWEARMDALLYANVGTDVLAERKRAWDELQAVFSDEQPQIQLVVQNFYAAGRKNLGNFNPSVMSPYTHWNIEILFKKQ